MGSEGLFVAVDHRGNPRFEIGFEYCLQPLFAHGVTPTFECFVKVAHPPETAFLRCHGIINQAFANTVVWAINTAHHKHVAYACFRKRDIFFKVGIGLWSGGWRSVYSK